MRTAVLLSVVWMAACSAPAETEPTLDPAPADIEPASAAIPSVGLLPPPTGPAMTGTTLAPKPVEGKVVANASPALATTVYSWNQSQGYSTVMFSQNSGWCFLSNVSGHFVGFGEAVWIANSNGYWVLTGQSQQQGVSAEATCVPWSTLQPGYSNVSYTWDNYESAIAAPNCWVNGTCPLNKLTLWGNAGFCSLMGVGGSFSGGGSTKVHVTANPSTGSWEENVVTISTNGTEAWAGCFHFNVNSSYANEANWQQGQPEVIFNSADRGCGLESMTGNFQGSGESVTCLPQWALYGTSGQSGVAADCRCLSP